MNKIILITYVSILTISTLLLSGFLFNLESFCMNQFNDRFILLSKLLLILFIPCFILKWFFEKRKYKGLMTIYITPILLLLGFFILDEIKTKQFFNNNTIIIDQAIITKKTHSKLSWYVEAKFQINQDTFRRKFKINGNLLKTKNKGDTILIKYIKDCPKIMTEFDFSPSKKDLKSYRNGKLIQD
ncbi:hypothetical protein [uncultured Aquimarina sp.]|uniref:hypothetical protein n=1 Tax=uncultured Aquimarina sp. TaxID=575652 RepID=UPI00261B56C1|nr:hypothetical protein [uncultured Aquimarina sp.]